MSQTPLSSQSSAPVPNLNSIQGDVVIGLHKRVELFLFFSIADSGTFRRHLKNDIANLITSTQDVLNDAKKISDSRAKAGSRIWLPIVQNNIAFASRGLTKLGITGPDMPGGPQSAFALGQQVDAITHLGDPVDASKKLTTWKPEFLSNNIDGVFLVTGPSTDLVDDRVQKLLSILGYSIIVLLEVEGKVRPGAEAGHEQFGFLDGISIPAVKGVNDATAHPGEDIVDPSNILVGHASASPTGTNPPTATSPSWTTDGSFLVFRKLQQLVPEFHAQSATLAKGLQTSIPGITPEFLEARMVGRWKSGAPLDLVPIQDDPTLGGDPQRNNNFDYSDDLQQVKCPYAAHVRKTNPRAGTGIIPRQTGILPRLMIRQGIAYGPETTINERRSGKTEYDRGLLFVAYQASIEQSFQFVQRAWANSTTFPPNTDKIVTPGTDPIIGQVSGAPSFQTQNIINRTGGETDPANVVTLTTHVVPQGGEYFFVPPINSIKTKLGA